MSHPPIDPNSSTTAEEFEPDGSPVPTDAEEFSSEAKSNKGMLTLRYKVQHWQKNIGTFIDHSWRSTCVVSGSVKDDSGKVIAFDALTVGFFKGCGHNDEDFPASHAARVATAKSSFKLEASLKNKVDHWSGWAELRKGNEVYVFGWCSKRCSET